MSLAGAIIKEMARVIVREIRARVKLVAEKTRVI
jgi:hypothetical protein